MRLLAKLLLTVGLTLSITATSAAQNTVTTTGKEAGIRGTATSSTGQPLTNSTVNARNLVTGKVGGYARTLSGGEFSISPLTPGSYIIEIVNGQGQIVGTSAYVSVAAGSTATTSVVATGGAMGAVSGTTLTTTAIQSVKAMAIAAGVAGVVAPANSPTASPSR